MQNKVAVIGLGYVGLPVAVAFGRVLDGTVGFDINTARVAALRRGRDTTNEFSADDLIASGVNFTSAPEDLADVDVFIVCVPTPVHEDKRPDFRPLIAASRTVGEQMRKGCTIIYESTVYPGATEEICRPALAEASGLTPGVDFFVAYSPERINPGDADHTLQTIVKVVSGEDTATLDLVSSLYSKIVPAGVHATTSIRVAEAAKVIENIQRDLNIALMNEIAKICHLLGIDTSEVLKAAGTKWNFLSFRPGLVGGHCIGVDPYYLTSKAQSLGYHPEVILSGRRINDSMGVYVANEIIKLVSIASLDRLANVRIAILGVTFKENVPDIRNSKVPDIIAELKTFGITPLIHDPVADRKQVERELGLTLSDVGDLTELDAIVLAVPHTEYLQDFDGYAAGLTNRGIIFDVKTALAQWAGLKDVTYWSL